MLPGVPCIRYTLDLAAHASDRGNVVEENHAIHTPGAVRLQKLLARAGFGSRRECESLIASGRVSVNGVKVVEPGVRIDPLETVLCVDGKQVQRIESDHLITVAFHKPSGVLSSMGDPHGRKTLADFVGDIPQRVFHVGRLDYETEGLLLLSNDGELSHRLMHPSFEVSKTYLIEVAAPVSKSVDEALRNGMQLEDGRAAADALHRIRESNNRVVFEMQLHEGRNRIVRRMFQHVRCPVLRLTRTKLGPIHLDQLPAGEYRLLTSDEMHSLKSMQDKGTSSKPISRMSLINPNPQVFETQTIQRHENGQPEDAQAEFDEDAVDEYDALEVFDLLRHIIDPEHPLTLEQLNVMQHEGITVDNESNTVTIHFTPTITHCSMATLIGLCIRVKLLRSMPKRFKVDIMVSPGSHQSEEAVNKQLNDKERIAAALENTKLLGVVNKCISG